MKLKLSKKNSLILYYGFFEYGHVYIQMSEIDWWQEPSFYYTDSMQLICNDEKVCVAYHNQ